MTYFAHISVYRKKEKKKKGKRVLRIYLGSVFCHLFFQLCDEFSFGRLWGSWKTFRSLLFIFRCFCPVFCGVSLNPLFLPPVTAPLAATEAHSMVKAIPMLNSWRCVVLVKVFIHFFFPNIPLFTWPNGFLPWRSCLYRFHCTTSQEFDKSSWRSFAVKVFFVFHTSASTVP